GRGKGIPSIHEYGHLETGSSTAARGAEPFDLCAHRRGAGGRGGALFAGPFAGGGGGAAGGRRPLPSRGRGPQSRTPFCPHKGGGRRASGGCSTGSRTSSWWRRAC